MADENKDEIEEIEELSQNDENSSNTKEEASVDNIEDSELEKENIEEIPEISEEEKKKNLIKKILFSIIGFLVFVILIGFILYLVGFFDPEIKEEIPVEKKEIKLEKNNYKFNINDIDVAKLNKQLQLLSNKELKAQEAAEEKIRLRNLEIEKKAIEEEKKRKEAILAEEEEKIKIEKEILEKKKLELQKQKDELEKLKQEALFLRDVMMKNKQTLENEIKEDVKETIVTEVKEEIITDNTFISLINVAKVKDNLYKSYLDKIVAINPDIKLCRDDKNIIEIYFGPFKNLEERDLLFDKLQEKGFNESYKVELTNKEFIKRCKY